MKRSRWCTVLLSCVLVVVVCGGAAGRDWPTYLGDAARSGITPERLELPLHEKWVHVPREAPRPAWPAPAKRDIWHEVRELSPVVIYDRAFHAVSVGDSVYFSSSADDQVYCLDADTGEKRWSFFAEGPVRLAPTIANGNVYFGSDDGCVYCLRANDGTLVWKHRAAEDEAHSMRRIPGNGRVISIAPARTGVVVDGGIAYYFTGLFPPEHVYRCALDAETGAVVWCRKCEDVSPQGYLVASPTRLFVPTGRTAPVMFDRKTADGLGPLSGPGGAYAVLLDEGVVSGPGRREGNQLDYAEPATHETIASFPGIRMIVSGDMAYLESKEEMSALNRTPYIALSRERNTFIKPCDDLKKKQEGPAGKDPVEAPRLKEEIEKLDQKIAELTKQMDACYLWKKPAADPYAMVLAGDVLFVGGNDRVRAVRASDGEELWTAVTPGYVYGLSVANGKLLASTSEGAIRCFAGGAVEPARVVKAADNPAPYAKDEVGAMCARAAESILKQSGIKKGYCLVLGSGEGRLAYELARRSELTIIGVERDAAKVAAARAALDSAGLYGVRVTVQQWDKATLPYTSYMANLVVSEEALVSGTLSIPAAEVFRVLRPCGGVACIGQPGGHGASLQPAALERWMKDGEIAALKESKVV